MPKLDIFVLERCPHCIKAKKFIEELVEEHEEFKQIEIVYHDEKKEVELANSYDYYYVPSIFRGQVKLHEGENTKEQLKEVLHKALV